MEKTISLKELNQNGQLVEMCKKVGYVTGGDRNPNIYEYPTICYLHYYMGEYIITDTIITKRQRRYHDFADAQREFLNFVSCIQDGEIGNDLIEYIATAYV